MSKNAASEVVHTFRSVRTGGVMNIWATDYIPRLIHCFCRVSFTSPFEVKYCENDYFEKKKHIRTGCLWILRFIWWFDICYSDLRLTMFRVTKICFSYSLVLTGEVSLWIVAGIENTSGCIFKSISASGGQNNAGN